MIAALRLSVFAVLAALTLTGQADAEAPKNPLPSPGVVETEALHFFAKCIVDKSEARVKAVLDLEYPTKPYVDGIMDLAKTHGKCALGKTSMSGVLFPGALAEASLRKDWDQAELTALLRTPDPAPTARSEIDYTGICLVLSHPQEVGALLFSDPKSKKADEMISGLAPYLANCVHKGQTLRINKAGLRAITALAAYRLADVNSATGKI